STAGRRQAGRFPLALWFAIQSQQSPFLGQSGEVHTQLARFLDMLGQLVSNFVPVKKKDGVIKGMSCGLIP
ncbi:MAG: hypothetical protein ACWGQW_09660, partial [bacterium]